MLGMGKKGSEVQERSLCWRRAGGTMGGQAIRGQVMGYDREGCRVKCLGCGDLRKVLPC